jgi:hypothetical protein
MKKTLYFYRLTDFKGDQRITVVDDPSDSGCIGGYGKDGIYQQYDSYELYHAYEWAEDRGMKLQYGEIEIVIPDEIFVD